MGSNISHDITKRKRDEALYNMIPNLFWSLLCLIPLYMFCERHVSLKLIYWFASLSLLTIFIPGRVLDRLQFSQSRSFYKRIGIEIINRFAQNGTLVNKMLSKKYPDYKVAAPNRPTIKRLIGHTYMFEKFHLMMFFIFLLVTIYALLNSFWIWAFVLMMGNLIYNVFPNLLQQYIRIRMKGFLAKSQKPTS